MIKYQLCCPGDHEFEGWFRDSADFDRQVEDGLLECPGCGSAEIRKAIMAPAIARSASRRRDGPAKADFFKEMAQAAERARDYVEKNFDYVGERFPEEARRIHYGETSSRGIYGEASGKEVKELAEEGVSVAPLPAVNRTKDAAAPPKLPKGAAKKLN